MAFNAFPSLSPAFPIARSPAVDTVRQESISGKRTLLPLRTVPRWKWQITYQILRSAYFTYGSFDELETLTGFWLAQSISGLPFAYTEAEDSTATNQGFGEGDGETTAFQLTRGRSGFAEPVYAPTIITSVEIAGTPTAAYTLGATGIVTFNSAPGAAQALTWSGSYAWLCRFDEDTLNLSRFMAGLSEAKSVKFSSEIAP